MFLHGYLSSKEAFTAQIEYFSRFFRVTAFDFIGFGGSAALTKAFSVSDYAVWTEEVFSHLGIEKPYVIAHSFGCRVAVKMASRGVKMEKLILAGPAGIRRKRGLGYRIKVSAYRFTRRFAPKFAEKHFGSAEYRLLSPIMKESYKKIVNEDLREDIRKIEQPVLLVEGEGDKTTPLVEAKIYLSCLQRGRLKMIRGGHFAFAEYPSLFNLIAEEFLYE